MKTAASVLILAALVALGVMSVAPAGWVGVRSGFGSLAGVATAVGLLAILLVGGWVWLRDRERKND